jgi:hypothetical protein
MSEEREDKQPKFEPSYPDTLHPDVIGECRKEWANGRPWTHIQVLRNGVDNSDGASCAYTAGCSKPVEAVQYTSVWGDAVFYCADHAVMQQSMDVFHYDRRPKPIPELTTEQKNFIAKILAKAKKKKEDRDGGPKEEDDL